jgi:Clr5 domain
MAGAGQRSESLTSLPREQADKLPDTKQRREMVPKEQWLALKPVIEQLYVKEQQTFNEVAQHLQKYHNFSPT